jgi:hypothetical protein
MFVGAPTTLRSLAPHHIIKYAKANQFFYHTLPRRATFPIIFPASISLLTPFFEFRRLAASLAVACGSAVPLRRKRGFCVFILVGKHGLCEPPLAALNVFSTEPTPVLSATYRGRGKLLTTVFSGREL